MQHFFILTYNICIDIGIFKRILSPVLPMNEIKDIIIYIRKELINNV